MEKKIDEINGMNDDIKRKFIEEIKILIAKDKIKSNNREEIGSLINDIKKIKEFYLEKNKNFNKIKDLNLNLK